MQTLPAPPPPRPPLPLAHRHHSIRSHPRPSRPHWSARDRPPLHRHHHRYHQHHPYPHHCHRLCRAGSGVSTAAALSTHNYPAPSSEPPLQLPPLLLPRLSQLPSRRNPWGAGGGRSFVAAGPLPVIRPPLCGHPIARLAPPSVG